MRTWVISSLHKLYPLLIWGAAAGLALRFHTQDRMGVSVTPRLRAPSSQLATDEIYQVPQLFLK